MSVRASSLVGLLSTASLCAACGYGDHMHHDGYGDPYGPGPGPATGSVEQATIDTDQGLDVEPGAGAGAFIEYASGGNYRVTTSCDVQGGSCAWDLLVTPLDGATIDAISPLDLESDDSLSTGAGQVRFVASTGSDFDGFTLQTDPGAAIEVDALLDGGAANRFLFWVGDGALHSGAPSNPVDLVPSSD